MKTETCKLYSFEYFCQISSKSILKISIYTVSKLGRFFRQMYLFCCTVEFTDLGLHRTKWKLAFVCFSFFFLYICFVLVRSAFLSSLNCSVVSYRVFVFIADNATRLMAAMMMIIIIMMMVMTSPTDAELNATEAVEKMMREWFNPPAALARAITPHDAFLFNKVPCLHHELLANKRLQEQTNRKNCAFSLVKCIRRWRERTEEKFGLRFMDSHFAKIRAKAISTFSLTLTFDLWPLWSRHYFTIY